MNKARQLNEIHSKWFKDCVCELQKTATQPVPGVGNPEARIVFIGEAPGKDEDEQGQPFVGRAGKFLNEMLTSIGMKREDVYITNTVKYRPPNNRDPLPEEKSACYHWLADELNCIQPKLIVTLGRHALSNFVPEARISDVHGKVLKKRAHLHLADGNSIVLSTEYFFPLYHPAAAMYNGDLRKVIIEDFKKIPEILKNYAASREV